MKTVPEIEDELREIAERLDELGDNAKQAALEYAHTILQRNLLLAGSGQLSIANKYIMEDADIVSDAKFIGEKVKDLAFDIERLLGGLLGHVTRLHEDYTEAIQDGAEHRRQIDELTSNASPRMRKHLIHIPAIREAVWAITGGKCYYCDIALVRVADAANQHLAFHIDHIVPKSSGGPDHISNYVPACSVCNMEKRATPFATFVAQKRPRLRVVEGGGS